MVSPICSTVGYGGNRTLPVHISSPETNVTYGMLSRSFSNGKYVTKYMLGLKFYSKIQSEVYNGVCSRVRKK